MSGARLRMILLVAAGIGALGCDSDEPPPNTESTVDRGAPPTAEEIAALRGNGTQRPRASSNPHAGGGPGPNEALSPGQITGTVTETMSSGGYTYMSLDTGDGEVWVAAMQMTVAEGDRVEVAGGSTMRGFHSRTLDRTFDEIIFASRAQLTGSPSAPGGPSGLPPGHPPAGQAPPVPAGSALPPGHPPTGQAPPVPAPVPAGGALPPDHPPI